MSRLNRKALRKMLLKEFKMIGMGNMGTLGSAPLGMPSRGCDSCGSSPCGCQEVQEDYLEKPATHSQQGSVSREDCCEAVKCLIECCSCPVTKQALLECCEDILAGRHDH